MAGNENSGNKQFVSRELTGEVRKLTLQEIRKVLLGEDNDFKKQVILRLAGTVLPRLMEHSGEDGGAIDVNIMNYERAKQTIIGGTGSDKGDSPE